MRSLTLRINSGNSGTGFVDDIGSSEVEDHEKEEKCDEDYEYHEEADEDISQ